jgi:colicin import membrane protein
LIAMRDYGVSLLLALGVHGLVAASLWIGWEPDVESSIVVKPQLVIAELIVLQPPKPKPRPRAQPKPAPVAKPEPRVEPKPEPKPQPQEDRQASERAAQLAAERARQAADAQRQQRLTELASSSFDLALAEESEVLSGDEQEIAARSFAQGIYQLIVANWSRPPSARNGMQARLIVELIPTGDVVSVTVVQSSGSEAFDRSAEQAVRKVGKFDVPTETALFEQYFRRLPVLFRPEDLLR